MAVAGQDLLLSLALSLAGGLAAGALAAHVTRRELAALMTGPFGERGLKLPPVPLWPAPIAGAITAAIADAGLAAGAALLVAIACGDARRRLVAPYLVIVLVLLGLAWQSVHGRMIDGLAGAGLAAVTLMLGDVLGRRLTGRKEGLGAGDHKLGLAIGLWTGEAATIALAISAAAVIIGTIATRRRGAAFAPALALGAIAAIAWREAEVDAWWMALLLP